MILQKKEQNPQREHAQPRKCSLVPYVPFSSGKSGQRFKTAITQPGLPARGAGGVPRLAGLQTQLVIAARKFLRKKKETGSD
jgi:hypothetical protein